MKTSFGPKTILYPTPVMVIGTYDEAGRANAMTAAWGGICCSSPPCIAVSIRKATYSYGNIVQRQAFTVNVPSEALMEAADYFGMVSGKSEDKFRVTGLTPLKADHVDAPYIEEFPLVVECTVIKMLEIGLHTQFIGEIMDVKIEDALLTGGRPDLEKLRPCIYAPELRAYFSVGKEFGKAFSIGKGKQTESK